MAARGTCCGGYCRCCLLCAQSIPQLAYAILLTLLQLASLALAAFLVLWALAWLGSPVSAFLSAEFFGAAIGLGAYAAIAALYGFIAPLACRGQKDDHLKIYYVLQLLALLVFIVFTILAMLNAHDTANIQTMLDYGWQMAFKSSARQVQISAAELVGKCCGFTGPADRAVQPCSGTVGCQSGLASSASKQLGLVGLLFAAGAGGSLVLMGLTHAYIERINFDRQKAASGSAQGMSIYSGQDASREPGAPPVKNAARAMFTRSAPRGALPPTNVRTGSGAAGAYYYTDDPSGEAIDDQPDMGGRSSRRR